MPNNNEKESILDRHPPIRCWYCNRPSPVRSVLEMGIIVSRSREEGGPYRIYNCPYCLVEGICEETPKGRWFASPRYRVGILDYLFTFSEGKGKDSETIKLIKNLAWLKENEERRRYFFERDGDFRYSKGSLLNLLWPWRTTSPADQENDRPKEDRTDEPKTSSRQKQKQESQQKRQKKQEQEQEQRRKNPPSAPRPPTPHEILGVSSEATIEEVRIRFHRLAVQYHPDKVHNRGEEFRNLAHEKFIELQKAYNRILKEHPDEAASEAPAENSEEDGGTS